MLYWEGKGKIIYSVGVIFVKIEGLVRIVLVYSWFLMFYDGLDLVMLILSLLVFLLKYL